MPCTSCGKAKQQRGNLQQAAPPKTAAQILAQQIQQQNRQQPQPNYPSQKQRVYR